MTNEIEAVPKKSIKRLQIIEAAFKLFTENGFYATGVDLIMRQANVSKRTMYIYFPTKNDLIVAVLEFYRANYEQGLTDLLARNDLSNREKIIAIFEDAGNWFENRQFHGCLAVNAMGEFSGKDPKIENACRVFKTWELDVFRKLTKGLPVMYPNDLAFKLLVLLEGMGAIAQVMKQPCPIDIRQMVNDLMDGHCVA
ncbi:MAG: TetR/AcrR family transcriptional regulator [Methylococcaceae bacterium]